MEMEMEIVSRETIKPSSPTPPHLRIYPLTFIDHIVFRNYIPLLFFYSPIPNHHNTHHHQTLTSKISTLKISLSKVLSRYYPFAGTLKDQISIECNDQGVSLIVTKLTCNISWILNNPTEASLNPLFHDELQWKPLSTNLVAIQINSFACGGIAISVCMCHKIGDAATVSNFINDWATFNREEEAEITLLPFPVPGASFFPQENLPIFPEAAFVEDNSVVCRRFVFEASKIDSLKAIVSSHNVANPTRVEVVSAWIYKRAVSALGLSWKTTSFRSAVNLRKRTVPPLPEKSLGNLVWFLFVFNPMVTELHELVVKMKQGLNNFSETYAKKFGGKDKDLSFIRECLKQASCSVPEQSESESESESESQSYICYSSWCRFPMYEADFGWGKPVWFSTSGCPVKNSIVLMDTRDGNGIEALVNMEEKDMAKFERDVDLLQYASLNPSLGNGNHGTLLT